VERGAALFGMPSGSANNGGCVACHGGPGWTASRRFFTPSSAGNASLAAAAFTPPVAWAPGWNAHTLQIAPQPASVDADPAAEGPPQVACVLRDVGTFGPDALEVRANGARAQGAGGYNVPSLYGLNVGAPYLHHGLARTLEELFTDPRFEEHTRAANPVFLTTGDVAQQRADLIAFLRSIDATTPEQPLPAGFDGCAP
jgi:cytochrome c peroxidase